MPTATRLDTDMSMWADGTLHFVTSDGEHYAVESSTEAIPEGAQCMIDELLAVIGTGRQALKLRLRPTVVFACNEDGTPAGTLTPVAEFPPGTTHEQALAQMGYAVE